VLPGLIDAHGHGGHSLIKTIGADTPTFWMRIVTASRSIGITSGGDRTAAEHLPSCR
jgi:cytosine/adenosine deaminase-related metal-dependent hydrolase